MLNSLLFVASALFMTSAAPSPDRAAVQAKNGEFLFSKYPPRALAAGEQGAVGFRAKVDANGKVLGCEVTRSSGHRLLDSETCDLIAAHAAFAPALESDGKARKAVHEGVVNWRIPGASPAGPKVAASSANTPDKIICKKSLKTGSLVTRSRMCLTQREWSRYASQTQKDWGDLQGRKGTTNGN